jgi:hypothetical protein
MTQKAAGTLKFQDVIMTRYLIAGAALSEKRSDE